MVLDILIASFILFFSTSAGAVLLYFFKNLKKSTYSIFISFAASVMLYSSFQMLLTSNEKIGFFYSFFTLILGAFVIFLLEKFLPDIHKKIKKEPLLDYKKKILLIIIAIAIHNIPEGFSVASAFSSSINLGWFVTTSIAIQDIPEGILIALPLIFYGINKNKAIFFGIVSGVSEGISAILGFLFLQRFSFFIDYSLGFAAGTMIYVVFDELIPQAFENKNYFLSVLSFIVGLIVAFLLSLIFS